MTQEIIDFINKHENLIDNNEWDELYTFAGKELFFKDMGDFTFCLIEAYIHPENYLRELPAYFLYNSDIKEFNIPSNIKRIGHAACEMCYNLSSITIPDTITDINVSAFRYCTSLTSVTIPNSVTSISSIAFGDCSSLTSVTLPDSVVSIDNYAFENCGDNLTINYSGTKADWKKIYTSKAFQNTYFTVNCSDGKIVKKKR